MLMMELEQLIPQVLVIALITMFVVELASSVVLSPEVFERDLKWRINEFLVLKIPACDGALEF